ncbi:retrovirus-related pol polyprotein from transposon TNT 1-94 [Tanacetum coccineum]
MAKTIKTMTKIQSSKIAKQEGTRLTTMTTKNQEHSELKRQKQSPNLMKRVINELHFGGELIASNFIESIKEARSRVQDLTSGEIVSLNLLKLKNLRKNEVLKAQIQDKVFVITSLKNDLRKLKGKEIVDIVAQIPSANTIVPGMFKLDLYPLAPKLFQNREAHIDYLKYTQEQADILQGIVEQAKAKQPLDNALDFAFNKKNRVVEPIRDVDVKHSLLKANSKLICDTYKKSMFDGVHDLCLLDFVENVNSRAKSAKKHKKQNIWKPTGHVFTEVGLKWKPTGRTFTIVGNSCPLTRITSTNVVPPKKTTSHSVETQKTELKDYNRKSKNVKNVGSSKKAKIVVQIVHWYLDSGCTVRFGNDHIARIIGYGDYQLGNVTISRVYYVEGLGHNLFSVGQFYDADLEVAFQKKTCFIRNLEGVDLLSGSRDINLYTISLEDMLKTSLICLLSKASKTKSWLWHRRLSHLNFGTINKLAKDGLARGIPRLKFQKDHLCSACALGKSKKSSHQPKAEDTNQEKLYLLHMDLCGPMRVVSINGKRYILVIVDDYSRFTWVRFLRTKDEAPEAIIKCIKNIQVRLNATVRNVRTDNGTEFVNQTLREFYENVGISHQTSVARTPQQNGVVERQNRTLVEVARTMLIFSKALLFLWAEAINTACYTQNRSIIRRRYNKTPYELMQDKKPDLSFFHVFGALCYPTNDNDDLGKLDAKADIGIFVGYAPAKKAFRIYNKRTQKIIETIHVTFDELTAMASEQFSSGPGLQCMTPATSSSGLVPNPVSQQPCIPPNRDDWDHLFQPMFDEYFTPPSIAVSPVQEAAAPRAVVLADSPVSTSIDQDAPSSSTPSTQEQEQSPNISQGFEESPKTPIFRDDPLNESPHEESTSQGSSSNVRQTHTPFEHLGKWTKDHPIANVIGDPSRSVSTRKQLQTDAMWCYFDAFLTSVEPKNFKQAMTEPNLH